MKRLFMLLCLLLLCATSCYAEQTAVACFQQGFNIAAKAYNTGDSSAFTPVYGMSAKVMETSPC